MKNRIDTTQWYSGNSSKDKFVTCISGKLDEIYHNGITVAYDWLNQTANLPPKEHWTHRRLYWLHSVRLRYAEWKKNETSIAGILTEAQKVIIQEEDYYTRQMYKVLEADCYVALYKSSGGRIHPLFKKYHRQLLIIIDDFMLIPQHSVPHRAFVEDCNKVFNVAGGIEKVCGSKLYQQPYQEEVQKTEIKGNVVKFQSREESIVGRKITRVLAYLNQWLGNKGKTQSHYSMRILLEYVDRANKHVSETLGVSPDRLFSKNNHSSTCIEEDVSNARETMLKTLDKINPNTYNPSFWHLYIELVIQTTISCMQRSNLHFVKNDTALQQAARWPLHEEMHRIISSLASHPDYLDYLLNKKIIYSESLLYGIFSKLAMESVSVVYCGYDVIHHGSDEPNFELHCNNGRGLERIYKELVKLVYFASQERIGEGFSIKFSDDTGMNLSLDIACVYTGTQLVILGIPKRFTFNSHEYFSSTYILGELFELVGFQFITNQVIKIFGPKTPEVSAQKFKKAKLETASNRKESFHQRQHFISNFIGQEETTEIKYLNDSHFNDMIEAVRVRNK